MPPWASMHEFSVGKVEFVSISGVVWEWFRYQANNSKKVLNMDSRLLVLPLSIASALALVGMFDLPLGYYQFLRWTLSLVAILLSVGAWNLDQRYWLLLSAPIFVLWFPPFQVYLDKSTWVFLDLFASVGLAAAAWSFRYSPKD